MRQRRHGESRRGARHRGEGRMRHGDVRAALLLALADGPAHGYELGQRLLRASEGAWQPSPGSIYPTLSALADEDLVTAEEREQKRVYTLTRRGHAAVKERSARGEKVPWEGAGDGLRDALSGLKLAAKQVAVAGTEEQREEARAIVEEARRQLYQILARG